MGGSSRPDPARPPSAENPFAVAERAAAPIAELLLRGARMVLTHDYGPQVGFERPGSEPARGVIHEVPLDSLVAGSQGAVGYWIQRDLREALRRRGGEIEVATVVTEVEVNPADSAFAHPTQPVGRHYSAAEADQLRRSRGWDMVEDSPRGYRRVLPSPQPIEIIQIGTIRRLVDAGVTVIACGGGGIPVLRDAAGRITGLEAVIDKDCSSALLAIGLGARRLIITTGVDAVYRDYFTEHRAPLDVIGVEELRRLEAEGQFPQESMGPKIEAAILFLDGGGEEVIICHPESLTEAWEGHAGTRITKESA